MIKLFFWSIILATAAVGSVSASTRHALVIGNSNYSGGHRLVNPARDAKDMARQLKSMEYKVFRNRAQLDLQIDHFNETVNAFLRSVSDGDTALIYYAGHGASTDGQNYLIPILPDHIKLETRNDIRNRSISLQSIMERAELHNASGVNIFFVDACRDAPVERSLSRSINLTGMAALDQRTQPKGSFVGFATEYGALAEDGDSHNSPFTEALLENMKTRADSPIELMYKNVSDSVFLKTAGRQFPIQEPKIQGNYCLVPCALLTQIETDSLTDSTAVETIQQAPRPDNTGNLFTVRNIAIGAAAILLLGVLSSQGGDDSIAGFPLRITPPSP